MIHVGWVVLEPIVDDTIEYVHWRDRNVREWLDMLKRKGTLMRGG